jgi:hypothetical protein
MAHLVYLRRFSLLCRLQMNSQRRYPQQRPMNPQQPLIKGSVLPTHYHATRNREVAVEPCVPEPAAVALNVNL